MEDEKREREKVFCTAIIEELTFQMYIPVEMWRREGIEFLRYEGEIDEVGLLNRANDVVDEFGGKGRE